MSQSANVNPEPKAAGPGRIVTDYEAYLFGEGHWLRAWEKMGARPARRDGVAGYDFVVWAPNARGVSVVGDFNAVGRPRASAAEPRRERSVGAVHSGHPAGRLLQVRDSTRSRVRRSPRPIRSRSPPSCRRARPRSRPTSGVTSGATRRG